MTDVDLRKTLYFLVSPRNIEIKTRKYEFTDRGHQINQGFQGKKLSGMEFTAFEENCVPDSRLRRILRNDCYCFLTSIFAIFCLLSSRILQNNSLDLYSVEIRRYKLSFFAKAAALERHSSFFKNRCVKLKTWWGLELGT